MALAVSGAGSPGSQAGSQLVHTRANWPERRRTNALISGHQRTLPTRSPALNRQGPSATGRGSLMGRIDRWHLARRATQPVRLVGWTRPRGRRGRPALQPRRRRGDTGGKVAVPVGKIRYRRSMAPHRREGPTVGDLEGLELVESDGLSIWHQHSVVGSGKPRWQLDRAATGRAPSKISPLKSE